MIHQLLEELIRALYPVWGVVGLVVAWNYGAFSRVDWQTNGGTWRKIPSEWCKIIRFIVDGCASDVWALIRKRELPKTQPLFTGWGYSPGHLLRFFIMLSFITAAVFGFWLVNVDRSTWWTVKLMVIAIAVGMSITAGLGHLFIAWRFHPRRWRWMVMASAIYVVISMIIDHWIWN